MVRPAFARFLGEMIESSLRKCIQPLVSELRLQPGHDEMRASFIQTWFGQEPGFPDKAYHTLIDCLVIIPRPSQSAT